MSADHEDPPKEAATHQVVVVQREEVLSQAFSLLVMQEWLSAVGLALRQGRGIPRDPYIYNEVPNFNPDGDGRYHYIGCWEARRLKYGFESYISDDEFIELVNDVLREELDKYNVELKYVTRHNWDGSDQVFKIILKT